MKSVVLAWGLLYFSTPYLLAADRGPLDPEAFTLAMRKSTFLFRAANDSASIAGTVFLLDEGRPSDVLLVTATHIFENSTASDGYLMIPGAPPKSITVTLREKGRPRWRAHRRADVTAMRVRVPPELRREIVVPVERLADAKAVKAAHISPPSYVFPIGFPGGIPTSADGLANLRFGVLTTPIAMETVMRHTFDVDFPVFPGHSGGPVIHRDSGLIIGIVVSQKKVRDLSTNQETPLQIASAVYAGLVRDLIDIPPAPLLASPRPAQGGILQQPEENPLPPQRRRRGH